MREILFRGKSIHGEWFYGYLNQHRGDIRYDCDCEPIAGGCYYINDWQAKIDTGMYGQDYKVDPDTVGQFTGLTDRNGTKIFEGDIVQHEDVVSYIVWNPDNLRFEFAYKGNFRESIRAKLATVWGIEIIGNIYDNPELLEVNSDE